MTSHVSDSLVVSLDARFLRAPDGQVYNYPPDMLPDFFQLYRKVWRVIYVVARLIDTEEIPAECVCMNQDGVEFIAIPDYRGPVQALFMMPKIKVIIRRGVKPSHSVIIQTGGSAGLMEDAVLQPGRPYGMEITADPYDFFASGAYQGRLRPIIRRRMVQRQKRQAWNAAATSYVTEEALQKRYPYRPNTFTTFFSNIFLKEEAFAASPRTSFGDKGKFRLVFVGSLMHMAKAPDTLISALAKCISWGLDLELSLIGDGKNRPAMEALASDLGIADSVRFLGHLPAGEGVREQLRQTDLFVLASHQEGLPRATVEAMAQALPCIGSTVGGFPELLSPEEMVPPGDVDALANTLKSIITDPQRMKRLSAENLKSARNYHEDTLLQRRIEFYENVKHSTEIWLKSVQPIR